MFYKREECVDLNYIGYHNDINKIDDYDKHVELGMNKVQIFLLFTHSFTFPGCNHMRGVVPLCFNRQVITEIVMRIVVMNVESVFRMKTFMLIV